MAVKGGQDLIQNDGVAVCMVHANGHRHIQFASFFMTLPKNPPDMGVFLVQRVRLDIGESNGGQIDQVVGKAEDFRVDELKFFSCLRSCHEVCILPREVVK